MATKDLDIVVKLKDAASRGLKSVRSNIDGMGKASVGATKGLKTMYVQLAAVAGLLAGGALFGSAIRDFAAFDDNMRAAGAVMGATRKEMELLTETAQRMGRETRFTSAQSAEALKFLGMAGLEASEAISALPGVLELAAAGALDLGTAADIATNVLSAFGLEVENLSRVNDVLVKTFTSANVDLREIGEAFKIVGPIAKGVGSDFEDLVGAIGALGNAGIKGTLAGTALKGAIGALLNPTAQETKLLKGLEGRLGGVALKIRDSQGDFVGFEKILIQLEKAGLRGDEALKLFGERAGPGMAALLNMGSAELADLIQKLRDAGGVSKEIADQMEAGLGGQIRKTISILQAFKEKLGEVLGPTAIKIMQRFRAQVGYLIDTINQLKTDGTIDDWGENIVWVMDKVSAATSSAMLRISAFIQILKAGARAIKGDWEGADKALNGFVRDINKLFAEEEDPLSEKAGKFVGAITKEMYEEFLASAKDTGPIGKGTKKVSDAIANKIIDDPSIETKLKAALIKLNAQLAGEAAKIEGQYEQGLINLTQYYDERAEIVRRKIAAELAILSQRVAGETDVDKAAILNAQIAAKKEQLNTQLLNIENERIRAQAKLDQDRLRDHEKVNKLKIKSDKAYSDQKARILADGVTTMDAQNAKELADLQTKHNSELDAIRAFHAAVLEEKRALGVSEVELFKAQEAEKAAVTEQEALQTEETAQLIASQQLKAQEYQLNNLKLVAAGAADLFTNLYELTGKKSKEFFYLSKAAAIAEASINIAQGITKALAQGGVYGIATGAMVAVAGAAQLATIASQGLAEGGEVQGSSPHARADNIPAMLTAEEFVHPVSAVRHYGKDVMEGLRTKSIPKGIFSGYAGGGYVRSGRSRFADGGIVGTGVPSTTLNRNNTSPEINIINVTDPRELDKYMSTSAGQDAILNVLGARSEAANRMLRNGV